MTNRPPPRRSFAKAFRRGFIAEKCGPVAAQDAGLLDRNLIDRVAEPLLMLERYGGDQADIGIDDIDRIQTAAETHLENPDVGRGGTESVQGCQRAELEIRQGCVLAGSIDLFELCDEPVVRNVLTIDAHAFVVTHEVRRSVDRR